MIRKILKLTAWPKGLQPLQLFSGNVVHVLKDVAIPLFGIPLNGILKSGIAPAFRLGTRKTNVNSGNGFSRFISRGHYEKIVCYRKTTIIFLFLILHVIIGPSLFAQEESPYQINGWWTVDGDSVRITYELSVPIQKTYDVRVILKKDGDTTFTVVPKAANGAIGKVYFNGGALEIAWDYKKDVQAELQGKYRFDFIVTESVDEGGLKWWHYAAGGAAVLAGTIVAINAGKGESASILPGPPRIRP